MISYINYLSIFIELFATTFEIYVIINYFNESIKRKFQNKAIYLLAGLTYIVFISYLDKMKMFTNNKLLVTILIICVIAVSLYDEKFIHKILLSFLMIALMIMADLATFSIHNMFLLSKINNPPNPTYTRILMIFISKTIFYFLASICRKRNISLYNDIKLTWLYYFLITYTPLMSVATFFAVFYSLQFAPDDNHIFSAVLIASIGLLFINIFVFFLFESFLKGIRNQLDSDLMKQQYELQIEHFENVEKSQEILKSIKHDINNHLFCIEHYLDKGLIDDAKKYISNIDDKLIQSDLFSNSGNIIIDALLNNKYEILQNENIIFNKFFIIPENLFISNQDLCIILSNILDNAIEACKKVVDGKRFIDFTIEYEKEMLVIKMTNNFEDEPIMHDGKFTTLKNNKAFHGIGLKNVISTAEKYNGYVDFEVKDKVFTVKILLCNIKI